jgi:hypothetical protein
MESVHFNLIKCQMCHHSANSRSDLATHMKNKHPIRVIRFVMRSSKGALGCVNDIKSRSCPPPADLGDIKKEEEVERGQMVSRGNEEYSLNGYKVVNSCHECEYSTADRNNLKSHIMIVHLRIENEVGHDYTEYDIVQDVSANDVELGEEKKKPY